MPAGVSWPRYLVFFTTAMLTMFAGAQTVHIMYNPLSDFDRYVEEMTRSLEMNSKPKQN